MHTHCYGHRLIQIEEAAVEKLVAFLDINKMRKNPMVRNQSPYLSKKLYDDQYSQALVC